MKYFIISDIHGVYSKMIKALNDAGFDKDKDTLISVGDAFDRGPENTKVLKYLLDLPNKILLWGNHDGRLYSLATNMESMSYIDDYNGTTITIEEFGGLPFKPFTSLTKIQNKETEASKLLFQYFDQLHYCLEFPDLYITHAWLPLEEDLSGIKKNWKRMTAFKKWYNAMWGDSADYAAFGLFPDKRLLIGHFHAFRIAKVFGEQRVSETGIDMSTFENDKLIAIDGCTNSEYGKVNVYVYESDVEPIIY